MDPFRSGWFTSRWDWLIAWAACFVPAVLLVGIFHFAGVRPWANPPPDRIESYEHEQCEAIDTSGVFFQVQNFWSNFAYFAAGLLLLGLNDSWVGRYIGGVLIFLGLGSAWFHGTLSENGQTADIMGVYAALLVMIAYGFVEMIPLEQDGPWAWTVVLTATAIGAVGGILRTKIKFFDSDYFTLVLIFILLVYMVCVALRYPAQRLSREERIALGLKAQDSAVMPFVGFLTLGVVALIFKFTDGDKNLLANYGGEYDKCFYGHGSLIQGHALWHALSAGMFVCVFEYFRSFLARSRTVWPWRLPQS